MQSVLAPGSELHETRHFARAVTELGERRPVVAHTAIYNAQGLKIIDKGVAINASLYERLSQHRLQLPLAQCVGTTPTVSGPAVRDEVRRLIAGDRLCAALAEDLRGGATLLDELALVPMPRPVAFQLALMQELQPGLWQHSLRSALVAAWFASRTGLTRHDQRMLGAAGLLHDIGMLHVDPVLMEPSRGLAREQRRQLYSHPLVSVMVLERHPEYTGEVLQAVMQHHEALDGSGYPRHLAGGDIGPWGRVLALTELITGAAIHESPAPAARLSLALRMSAPRYDATLVGELMRVLQPLREELPGVAGDDPVQALRAVERQLMGWGEAVGAAAGLDPARQQAAARVAQLCEEERRALARSGASSDQLEMLGDEVRDQALAGELALIAREAAWQLRTVARQARRRWQLAAGESFPPSVQAWLEGAEALCERQLGG